MLLATTFRTSKPCAYDMMLMDSSRLLMTRMSSMSGCELSAEGPRPILSEESEGLTETSLMRLLAPRATLMTDTEFVPKFATNIVLTFCDRVTATGSGTGIRSISSEVFEFRTRIAFSAESAT